MKLNFLTILKAFGLIREFEQPISEVVDTIQAVDGLTGTERREVGLLVFIDANNSVQQRAAEVKARRNVPAKVDAHDPSSGLP